jgi:hypothetical protein
MSLTHEQLKKLHDKAYENGYDTRLKAADDMLFAWITQWDDTYLSETDLAYRGEFNILRKAMRQITTDLISNPIMVDFDPVDDTDDTAADIIDGMYRADMRNNTSQEAVKNCNQEVIVCGVGAWELRNEYKTNKAGDERQVIRRYPLYEANNNIMWDPNAKLLDKSDANYVSCLVAYSEDGYEELRDDLLEDGEYSDDSGKTVKDKAGSNFASPEISYVFPWVNSNKLIYVTRFYHRVKKKITYLTYVDSFNDEHTFPKSELKDREDDLFNGDAELVSEKTIERYEVTRYIASGDGILEATVIPGEHIPVIPQYGENQFVEGEHHYEGIVRLAKDPQRLRNFQMSYLADIVSKSPREKPIFFAEQVQGFEDMYEVSGPENNLPYALMNHADANGNPLPAGAVGAMKAPEIPPALAMSMQETRAAVDDVAGAGLPADITDVDLSGKALSQLNKRLDMQSYAYQDNHKFAMRRDGEVYASMISDIKDTEEEVVLVKLDGTKTTEKLNQRVVEFTDEGIENKIKNDVSQMSFDVYADIGPSFESVKEQSKEEIKELLNSQQLDPETHTILLSEYLMMIDGVAFKDLRDYSRKKLIMMGVKPPETDEEKAMVEEAKNAPQEPDAAMINAQAEMKKGEADLLEQQNRQAEMQLTATKIQADAQGKIEKLQSETQLNVAKIQQEQQKIDIDANDKVAKNALTLTGLELQAGVELNKQMQANRV